MPANPAPVHAGGTGENGELGTNDYVYNAVDTPATVAGGQIFVSVSAGEDHTCALDNTANAWCW